MKFLISQSILRVGLPDSLLTVGAACLINFLPGDKLHDNPTYPFQVG